MLRKSKLINSEVQKKLLESVDYNYFGRYEKYLKLGFCNFVPFEKNWKLLLEKSFFEIKASKYFSDKLEKNKNLIWENKNKLNYKTCIGKISLLEDINQLLFSIYKQELKPINLTEIEEISLKSYKSFAEVPICLKKKLKAVVLISYKEIRNHSEAIAYYPGSNINFSESKIKKTENNENYFKSKNDINFDLIYPNYGEVFVIDPNLICDLEHIINFEKFHCFFYASSIKRFINKKDIYVIPNIFIKTSDYSFVDNPKFSELMKSGFFGRFKKNASNFNKFGYTRFSVKDPEWISLIDKARNKLTKYINENNLDISNGIRFQDAWNELGIKETRDIASHPEILIFLKILFGRSPFPFQTLNFPTGSKQHFHSDAVHFSSEPKGFMCGVWVALEDIHPDSGCLEYYPGSHKEPYLSSRSIGLNSEKIINANSPQKFFEKEWRQLIKNRNYKRKTFAPKKGQILVWHANLLHGGSKINNLKLTRWSQVTHYYFYGCEYNTPFFNTTDKINKNLFNRNPLDMLKM